MTTKQLKDRERYIRDRDEYRARAKEYYQKHKEQVKEKVKECVKRQRALAIRNRVNERPLTTKELEAEQPEVIRKNITALREEYLGIHITERPPYELFLKMKLYEIEDNLNNQDNERTTTETSARGR